MEVCEGSTKGGREKFIVEKSNFTKVCKEIIKNMDFILVRD